MATVSRIRGDGEELHNGPNFKMNSALRDEYPCRRLAAQLRRRAHGAMPQGRHQRWEKNKIRREREMYPPIRRHQRRGNKIGPEDGQEQTAASVGVVTRLPQPMVDWGQSFSGEG